MRRHTASIWLALVPMAVVSCASDSGTPATTTSGTAAGTVPVTSPSTAAFTTQQLSDALLTTADLGTGWTETQRTVFATREPENPSIDPSLWCPAADGAGLVALAGDEGADVELQLGSPQTPFMVRQQAWTNADVARYLTATTAAVAACTGTSWTDSDGNTYRLEPSTTAPAIGDESVSWKVTIELTAPDQPLSFTEQTVARFGEVLMVIQAGATMTTSPDATAPNLVTLVRTAGDKMAGLTG